MNTTPPVTSLADLAALMGPDAQSADPSTPPVSAAAKEAEMTEMTPPTPVRLAPIPLVSGDTLTQQDGTQTKAVRVQVVITDDQGQERTIDLDWRYGGWWVPDDRMDG